MGFPDFLMLAWGSDFFFCFCDLCFVGCVCVCVAAILVLYGVIVAWTGPQAGWMLLFDHCVVSASWCLWALFVTYTVYCHG